MEQKSGHVKYCISWTDNHGDQHVYTNFEPTAWTIAKGLSALEITVTIDIIKDTHKETESKECPYCETKLINGHWKCYPEDY